MQKIQEAAQSRKTTLAGILSTTSGLVIAFIPHEVWSACSASIADSNSPALIGGLVVAGLVLTTVGPSIAKSRS